MIKKKYLKDLKAAHLEKNLTVDFTRGAGMVERYDIIELHNISFQHCPPDDPAFAHDIEVLRVKGGREYKVGDRPWLTKSPLDLQKIAIDLEDHGFKKWLFIFMVCEGSELSNPRDARVHAREIRNVYALGCTRQVTSTDQYFKIIKGTYVDEKMAKRDAELKEIKEALEEMAREVSKERWREAPTNEEKVRRDRETAKRSVKTNLAGVFSPEEYSPKADSGGIGGTRRKRRTKRYKKSKKRYTRHRKATRKRYSKRQCPIVVFFLFSMKTSILCIL
jgi:hypothetical protein